MALPPLTHHDIIRLASPLARHGLKVDMSLSDRQARYLQFQIQAGDQPHTHRIYSLSLAREQGQILTRTLLHQHGLVATIHSQCEDAESALHAIRAIPEHRQLRISSAGTSAFSYTLIDTASGNHTQANAYLQFAVAQLHSVELRVDVSTSGAMPADVRVLQSATHTAYLPDLLASGEALPLRHRSARHPDLQRSNHPDKRPAKTTGHAGLPIQLPEDVLAVLGPQWRALRDQGDHWKGVLRTLGREPQRTTRAEHFMEQAVHHLHHTLSQPPAAYHPRLLRCRWQVYVRRLKPLMAFLGILAMMPVSWLLVSRGEWVLHPLALGLTPLLMVGVIVITAREIPIMEIPARPKPLPDDAWNPSEFP